MMLAARFGHDVIVEALIEHGSLVDSRSSNGQTALMIASAAGHVVVVQTLLNHHASVTMTCDHGSTALTSAAASGFDNVVALLLDHEAFIDARTIHGETALMFASANGYEAVVRVLLDRDASIDFDADGWTAMERAVIAGHEYIVRILLEYHDVAKVFRWYRDLLSIAVNIGHEGIVRLLLELTNLETYFNINDAFAAAARKGHSGFMHMIVETSGVSQYGYEEAAKCAGMNGHDHVVKMIVDGLLSHEFLIYSEYQMAKKKRNDWAENEKTALYCAVLSANEEIVLQVLRTLGQDASSNVPGRALYHAVQIGNESLVRLLLDCDTVIEGVSALLCAIENRHEQILRLLLGNKYVKLLLLGNSNNSFPIRLKNECDQSIRAVKAHIPLESEDSSESGSDDSSESGSNKEIELRWRFHKNDCYRFEEAVCQSVADGYDQMGQLFVDFFLDCRSSENFHENNERAFVMAALIGSEPVVRELLELGIDANCPSHHNSNAMKCAARNGHTNIVRILLERVTITDHAMHENLVEAACNGNESTVDVLLERMTLKEWPMGYNVLIEAACNGHHSIVRLLLDGGASVDAQSECTTQSCECSGSALAGNGHENVVRLLLEYGASIDSISDGMLLGRTALMQAIWNENDALVQTLLQYKPDLNIQDEEEKTALINAVEVGNEKLVRTLLQKGAFVNGDTIHYAIYSIERNNSVDKLSIVKLLLDHITTMDLDSSRYGRSLLMDAAYLGNLDVVCLLVTRGAEVNLQSSKGETALSVAATNERDDVMQFLLTQGASIDLKGNDYWTPLIYAADNGKPRATRLLLKHGALVDATEKQLWTALMLAASKGHTKTVQILIDHGARLDKVNEDKRTALMIAASEGHVDCVRVLKENGASLGVTDKDNRTALMLAIKYSRSQVVRELLLDTSALDDAMSMLQDGLLQREMRAAEEAQKKYEVIITVDDVKQACARMNEAQPMFDRIHARLVDMKRQLKDNTSQLKSVDEAVRDHKQNMSRIHAFLVKCSSRMIARIVSNRHVMEKCQTMHEQLDEFVKLHNLKPASVHQWRLHWDEDRQSHELFFKNSLEQLKCNPLLLQNEFLDPKVQSETLTLLMFECENLNSKCTEEESNLIRRIFEFVKSFTKLEIPMVPNWFMPPHEVEFTPTSFASGSFGSVHLGTWLGASVVVKAVLRDNAQSRKSFLAEAEIWFKIKHQHVVSLFGACHVGNPFFVCEYASDGNLTDYLCRNKYDRVLTWKRLYEAALGVQYLHKVKVVHNDLKGNNILVGGDGKAKIADFGLSFVSGTRRDINDDDLAISWKAPEVLKRQTTGTFASDVYSFGMCILEAVKKDVWGTTPDVTIRRKVVQEKALPKRPQEMNDTQWNLIENMCKHNPKDRIKMNEVVAILRDIASQEEDDANEAAWKEYQENKRAAEIA